MATAMLNVYDEIMFSKTFLVLEDDWRTECHHHLMMLSDESAMIETSIFVPFIFCYFFQYNHEHTS